MTTASAKNVLVLKHVPNEDAGTLLDYMKAHAIANRPVHLYEDGELPEDINALRAVIIMGGPMNVDEEVRYPFLKKENAFIRRALKAGIPCLGICLGAQLIAKALGSRVYKAAKKEIGWEDVTLSPDAAKDGLFCEFPFPNLRVLQWHEDTFDLPSGAVHLASSAEVPNQAYRIGKNAYGLQFHIEVHSAMLEDWFKNYPQKDAVLREYAAYRGKLSEITERFYGRFFGLTRAEQARV